MNNDIMKYLDAMDTERGDVFSIQDYKGVIISRKQGIMQLNIAGFLLERSLLKDEITQLRKIKMSSIIILDTYKKANFVGVLVNTKNPKTRLFLNDIVKVLKDNKINVLTKSIYSDKEADHYIKYDFFLGNIKHTGLFIPVTKNEYEERMKVVEHQEKAKEGNLSKALTMALVGGIVGAIPAFIALFGFNLMSFLLYMIIPLASIYLYKKSGGPSKSIVPIVISIITVAIIIIMILYYYVMLAEINEISFAELFTYSEVVTGFVSDLLFSLIGAGVAVWFAWNKLNVKPTMI